jgi:hypothetical protein
MEAIFSSEMSVDFLNGLHGFVGFEVLTVVVMKIAILWRVTPCSPLNVNRRFWGTHCLHLQDRRISRERNLPPAFTLVSYSDYCSSETSVKTQWTTRRYIPEYSTLHYRRCENLKSYISSFLWKMIMWMAHLNSIYLLQAVSMTGCINEDHSSIFRSSCLVSTRPCSVCFWGSGFEKHFR